MNLQSHHLRQTFRHCRHLSSRIYQSFHQVVVHSYGGLISFSYKSHHWIWIIIVRFCLLDTFSNSFLEFFQLLFLSFMHPLWWTLFCLLIFFFHFLFWTCSLLLCPLRTSLFLFLFVYFFVSFWDTF